MHRLRKIELEITSDCNAACPGCARTQNIGKYAVTEFTFETLKNIFSNELMIRDKIFKFCGVLGDPAKNIDMLPMIEYLLKNGAYCEVSTNGGLQSSKWWESLGSLSKQHNGNLYVHFCIDGHRQTNHIYRVNTNFDIIERNITAYANAGGAAKWIYILFDHNEHEMETAKEHAKKLNFSFALRTGMRNSYHDWIAKLGKKNNKKEFKITTTGAKEHSKKDQVKELDNFIETYKTKEISEDEIVNVVNTITCKYVHEQEIFVASDLTVWPCCFLWDSYIKNVDNIREKIDFDNNWNSLKFNNIDDILSHDWFSKLLVLSWHPLHNQHLSRCIRTCAKNKAYHNEFTEVN